MIADGVDNEGGAGNPGAVRVDIKLEVVVIVSNVHRTTEFYRQLGWRLDGESRETRLLSFRISIARVQSAPA
jgi:hypothetical protein